jgi:1-acyl-sn-glycerol-3-phosphate acyltransferase
MNLMAIVLIIGFALSIFFIWLFQKIINLIPFMTKYDKIYTNYNILSIISAFYVKSMCTIDFKSNINKAIVEKEPVIYISNHQSFLDTFISGYIPSKDVVFMNKYEIIKMPFIGGVIKNIGTVLVKRKCVIGRNLSVEQCKESIINNKNIFIFPEGTYKEEIRDPNIIEPFRLGAFRLAKDTGAPLVLSKLKIKDTVDELKCEFHPKNKVYYHILEIVDPKDSKFADMDAEQLKDYCYDVINNYTF